MPKCPKCEEEINSLKAFSKEEVCYDFEVDSNADPDYSNKDFIDNIGGTDYDCPECGETLFTNENEATKFLIQPQ